MLLPTPFASETPTNDEHDVDEEVDGDEGVTAAYAALFDLDTLHVQEVNEGAISAAFL